MAVMAIPGKRPFVVAPEKTEAFLKEVSENSNRDLFFERLKRNDRGDTVWETKK